MLIRKVTRYYSDCGRGFWKKQQALTHDTNCKCWKNPKFKTCLTCIHKNLVNDSNGMEHEPQYLHTFVTNNCKYSESGQPAHIDYDHIIKNCNYHNPVK